MELMFGAALQITVMGRDDEFMRIFLFLSRIRIVIISIIG
jgi:hypothetical protein